MSWPIGPLSLCPLPFRLGARASLRRTRKKILPRSHTIPSHSRQRQLDCHPSRRSICNIYSCESFPDFCFHATLPSRRFQILALCRTLPSTSQPKNITACEVKDARFTTTNPSSTCCAHLLRLCEGAFTTSPSPSRAVPRRRGSTSSAFYLRLSFAVFKPAVHRHLLLHLRSVSLTLHLQFLHPFCVVTQPTVDTNSTRRPSTALHILPFEPTPRPDLKCHTTQYL